MKKRLKEMEEEAAALRDMQAKVEKEMGGSQGSNSLTCSHLLLLLESTKSLRERIFVFVLEFYEVMMGSLSFVSFLHYPRKSAILLDFMKLEFQCCE